METEEEKFRVLLRKYQAGQCTEEEAAWLESWYLRWNEAVKAPLSRAELDEARAVMWASVQRQTRQAPVRRLWVKAAAAAAVVLAASLGLYLYVFQAGEPALRTSSDQHDIVPGGNKATLTLANGRSIDLRSDKEGVAIRAGEIAYNDGTRLETGIRTPHATLATPPGGQYQVVLPDSTRVWLNAASSLTYPASFADLEERRVELQGEAYFEVARDRDRPFRVVTGMQEVEVLGTHFNINSYADEPVTATTLLEGRVMVRARSQKPGAVEEAAGNTKRETRNSKLLKPGQQSLLDEDQFNVREVDAEAAVAWKTGYFRFDDEALESIMRKISRWYDVEIIYRDEQLKKEPYAAVTTRFARVSRLLDMLEQTGVAQFTIEGRKIVISKKDDP